MPGDTWPALSAKNGNGFGHEITDEDGALVATVNGGREYWPLARAMAEGPALLAAAGALDDAIAAMPAEWHQVMSPELVIARVKLRGAICHALGIAPWDAESKEA